MTIRRTLKRFLSEKTTLIALAVILPLITASLLSELIAPFTNHYQSETSQDGPPGVMDDQLHRVHWLGTDDLGRDIFSRVLYSVRVSLLVGLGADAIILAVGLLVGLLAGYFGGWVDDVLMRFTDLMYAFPGLLFAMLLVATFGRSIVTMLVALGIAGWVNMARLVRSQVLQLRQMDYVLSARSIGAHSMWIIGQHLLPNVAGPVIVLTALTIPGLVTAEASLSFLGIGIDPSQPTLGGMINSGMASIFSHPTEVLFPLFVLAVLTLAFTFLGDALRDALDPRLSQR